MLLSPLVEFFTIVSPLGVHGEVLRVILVGEGTSLVPLKLLRMYIHLLVSLFSLIWILFDHMLIRWRNHCKSSLVMTTCLVVGVNMLITTGVHLMLILSI